MIRSIPPRVLAYAILCHQCFRRSEDEAAMRSILAADKLYWQRMTNEEHAIVDKIFTGLEDDEV